MKKVFISFVMCIFALSMFGQEYVDLGLPSGTKWKTHIESGYYTYDEAYKKFGNQIPTWAQLDELMQFCDYEDITYGRSPAIKIIGPNGNSLILVPMGLQASIDINEETLNARKGEIFYVGQYGFYMTSEYYRDNGEFQVRGLRLEVRQNGTVKVKPGAIDNNILKCTVILVK